MQKNRLGMWSKRVVIGLVVLILAAVAGAWLYLRGSLAQLDGTVQTPGLEAGASVARDAHGVPLISGGSRMDVAYATGFVHAQERYFQMDLLRRVSAGELSELFGARALPLDKSHRLHRFRARAELALKTMPAADRALLERYVDGVNAGLRKLGAKPFEYALIGMPPRAWSAADSLLVIWAMYFDLQGSQEPRELARGWFRDHATEEQRAFLAPESTQWDAPLDAPSVTSADIAIPAAPPAWWGKPKADGGAAHTDPKVAAAELLNTVGSNNWAVAGGRSDTGAAIVSDDMHLGIQLPAIWYRLALQFPDGKGGQRRVVGVTLPGTPAVVVGSNGHVAWGFTNSYGDYLDLIALDTDQAKPGQVRTQAGWETPVVHEETILIKGEPAAKLAVRETSLGPIREAMGRSYAIHWVAHTPAAVNVNARNLEFVDTLEQAMAVAATMGIPAQNFVGGDDKGNIGWTIAGALPRRAPAGVAATYPLSADDQAGVWTGWLKPEEYPKVVNPAAGQLATANSRQLANAGAELLGDGGFDLGARTHQVRDDLTALGPKTDVKKVYAVTLDDRAVFLTAWRERAMAALDAKAVEGKPQRAEALKLLKDSWTGKASVDSVGYRITRAYMYALYDILFESANEEMAKVDAKANMAAVTSRWPVVVARVLDEKPAAWLPPQYASWQALQLAALDRVIADLTKDGKPLASATWGERNTAASAHPFAAVVPVLGKYLKVAPDMLPGDQHMPRVSGPSFGQSERLTVSPGHEEQGVFNMPGGQSGHPLSPYFLDGRADWVSGRDTPLLPGPAAHTLTFVK
ncbi:penicillin acylase family protein [Duganella sp. BJB488]|uniref:penicillin acylase family protein n=1 Tax=unclassified Duganella TaxID=2636909 RepID=UPI000E341BCB|nr:MULTISPECIES: penicillin acylase family protein [unclassified Duganella]RFP09400.1 penicillin acylase family protein [Duganella sp. BJB489]RFP13078.1 penicillin acylase family protein [Duganella sp. BJB488]RFP29194.1 penicillin acylase family protein [Duganella sp. BJB480]